MAIFIVILNGYYHKVANIDNHGYCVASRCFITQVNFTPHELRTQGCCHLLVMLLWHAK